MPIHVSAAFDSGNIEVVKADSPGNIRVRIPNDTNSEFFQWFHFRINGVRGQHISVTIENAGDTTYPTGWPDYNVRTSYNRSDWFTTDSNYNGKALSWELDCESDTVYFAYFEPFSYQMHLDLIADCVDAGLCRHEVIGQTHEGRDMDLLVAGNEDNPERKVWVIARQHPGESMAEWFMAGFLERLFNNDDPVAKSLLEKVLFYIVPNMNPDGSIHGNLRASASGANLNREWAKPTQEYSPEVFHVRNEMDSRGLDILLDIHGDEDIPYNFISANEGIPSYSKEMNEMEELFKSYWEETCPDFQTEFGYEPDKPGQADLSIATNQIAERFNALAVTVEMPFLDNKNLPNPDTMWSGERSIELGKSILLPLAHVLKHWAL